MNLNGKNGNQENIDLGVLFAENEWKKIPIRKIRTHQTPPGKSLLWKFPHRKFPPGIFPPMFLNIPTRLFNFFALSQERLFCNSIFEKCWGQKFRSWCIKKSCSLPAQVLWSVTIIIHLFVLDYFIFEAFHEEHDFIQFSQLNDVGWILPGQLSSLPPVLPTTSLPPPPTPLHLVAPVECLLMNSKIIDVDVLARSS